MVSFKGIPKRFIPESLGHSKLSTRHGSRHNAPKNSLTKKVPPRFRVRSEFEVWDQLRKSERAKTRICAGSPRISKSPHWPQVAPVARRRHGKKQSSRGTFHFPFIPGIRIFPENLRTSGNTAPVFGKNDGRKEWERNQAPVRPSNGLASEFFGALARRAPFEAAPNLIVLLSA